eukprot:c9396_g1_i3.p1 GENE.c9396_g1_i3~~c9396_g1_i3.p1  ORF type:complete len:269 (+),score=35.56 c9396_g1_i3:462-1268(+)
MFWGLGRHLGYPGAQNRKGQLVTHVRDEFAGAASVGAVRQYRTNEHIGWHCDAAEVVGLVCCSVGRAGGLSRVASSLYIFNQFMDRHPGLVPRLFENHYMDVRDEGAATPIIPVRPCRYHAGHLRTFWHTEYFTSFTRHPQAPPLSPEDAEAIKIYDAIASEPDSYIEMSFEPGDIQLVNNHVLVHSRTAFEDDQSTGAQRHLVRLWLSLRHPLGPVESSMRVASKLSVGRAYVSTKLKLAKKNPRARKIPAPETQQVKSDSEMITQS